MSCPIDTVRYYLLYRWLAQLPATLSDVVRNRGNVGLRIDRFVVEQGDVGDDVQGRTPGDVHDEGHSMIRIIGRAVRSDVGNGDRSRADKPDMFRVVFRRGDDDH